MCSSPELPPEVFCSLTRHCYSSSLDFTSHTLLSNSKVKEQSPPVPGRESTFFVEMELVLILKSPQTEPST